MGLSFNATGIDHIVHHVRDPEVSTRFQDGLTRISFTPITGRTHQLRVHAAHELGLGIPIVGDPLYGRGTGPAQLKLHACDLSFHHPTTDEEIAFHSPPRF